MSFGRLLAAGRSLSGNVSGRYRMREGLRLPQFIAPKNPFTADAAVAPAAPPPIGSESRAVVSAVTRARKLAAVVAGAGRATRHAGVWLKRGAWWCLDHNPFSAIGRPRLPSLPRFGKPVQGELSLDKVQVVRGDLTHADLQVVPTGAPTSAAWRSLTSRVFGGGNR
jgi:hypothetical protein